MPGGGSRDRAEIRIDTVRKLLLHGDPAPNWHTGPMQALGLSLLFGAPWLAAIAVLWTRAPRDGTATPSLGQRALERLQTL